MFTGIIEEIGIVKTVKRQSHALELTVSAKKVLDDIKVGDSICVNGVCLTVKSFSASGFLADVMPETYQRSTLAKLVISDKVNLERALRLSDRMGGHIVTGHVDGIGKIMRTWKDENAVWFTIAADPGILRYVVEKGSVALEGISLTVADVDDRSFSVSIIPHTQMETTLLKKDTGNALNIECDLLGKYIEKLINRGKGNISVDFLQQMGF
jgi:riboflavin synthase